ncbi:DUF2513 domain-containing protein [Lichenibacterium ramalinae]|uniref:DUF2513 domain-containing protein n=1 Tax=Lichenibacterium ramalinae TaxID=2316527 RepID=A0A4Q2R6Q3_9HYPH|nr:DUF2513 domain-containing protein [Lichenibacterium ramalinae]RYB01349.1 DUF2513 domain-containing protein [Lichenibacterium ramalinae]
MKRDLYLCRELLLKLEAAMDQLLAIYHFVLGDEDLTIDGWPADEVSYNLARMLEAGFFATHSDTTAEGGFVFSGISWSGYEYLDAVRGPDRWRKTKDGAKSVGGLTFGLVKDFAFAIAKNEAMAKLENAPLRG